MKEDWGPKWLSKQKENLSFEFNVPGEVLIAFETEFRRDERVMRF
jgi:small subunit ribosomal protein S6